MGEEMHVNIETRRDRGVEKGKEMPMCHPPLSPLPSPHVVR
jgi:hypothetical protein